MGTKGIFNINEWDNHSAFEIANITEFAIVKENSNSILIGGFDITSEGFRMSYGFRMTDIGFDVVEVQPIQNMVIKSKTLVEPEFKAIIISESEFLDFMFGIEPIEDVGEVILSSFSEN